jgi:hypothetical protein
MEGAMPILKILTHIHAEPKAGGVELSIAIDDHAAITIDADQQEAQDLIDALEGTAH